MCLEWLMFSTSWVIALDHYVIIALCYVLRLGCCAVMGGCREMRLPIQTWTIVRLEKKKVKYKKLIVYQSLGMRWKKASSICTWRVTDHIFKQQNHNRVTNELLFLGSFFKLHAKKYRWPKIRVETEQNNWKNRSLIKYGKRSIQVTASCTFVPKYYDYHHEREREKTKGHWVHAQLSSNRFIRGHILIMKQMRCFYLLTLWFTTWQLSFPKPPATISFFFCP